jgi:UrcA family protein
MNNRKALAGLSLGCAAAALAWLGGIAPALASDFTARQVTVKYGDLNLDTREDAAKLLERIHTAARQVCGDASPRLDLEHAWQVCYQGSVNAAVAAVGSPVLSALASGTHYPAVTALNR